MNNTEDENLTPDAEEEDQGKPYTVIRERVKKRRKPIRKILKTCAAIIAGAILFGIVAAFVMSRFLPYFLQEKEPVAFEPDPTPTTAPTATPRPTVSVTKTPTPVPEETPTPIPTITVTPSPEEAVTPTPDPQKESEARIEENRLLYTDLRRIAAEPSKAIVTVTGITTTEDWFSYTEENTRTACGVIVADNGPEYLILTDYSAVENAASIYVTFFDGTIMESSLVKADPGSDLAVLLINKRNIDPETRRELVIASLGNSYNCAVGEPVIAVGSPAGYANAVIFGQITSVSNKIYLMDASYSLLRTNIFGSPSGTGVLINLEGEVVGFIVQAYGGNTVTAYAISQIKTLIETLSNDKPIAYLGIYGEDVSEEVSGTSGVPAGIYITDVVSDSPAFLAGIQRGDILVSIGNKNIPDMTALRSTLSSSIAGTRQTVGVRRLGAGGYAELTFDVDIGEN